MIHAIRLPRCCVALFLALAASAVLAQAFPTKPLRIVVPFAPGGAGDIVARVVGEQMGTFLGQPVVVENRPGGGSVIGTGVVAKAPADGYTMLVTSNPFTSNPSLIARLPFDTLADFIPVSVGGVTPIFVIVNAAVPATNLKELVALLKANPNKYNYASSGNAGPQHLAGELFKMATGTSILHVPFNGAAPAATALLAGDVQIAFASPSNVMQYVRNGRLRALAVTTAQRSPFAPEVPTMAELGYPDIDFAAWMGFFVPAGTPPAVVARLHDAAARSVGTPEIRNRLAQQAIEATASPSPAQFKTFIQRDIERAASIVKQAGIKLD